MSNTFLQIPFSLDVELPSTYRDTDGIIQRVDPSTIQILQDFPLLYLKTCFLDKASSYPEAVTTDMLK